MKEIRTRKGDVILVDDRDYEKYKNQVWGLSTKGYAKKQQHIYIGKNQYKGKSILMHRLITNAQLGTLVDHINGNKLDNRRENLRLCTPQENVRNSKLYRNNTTGIKGVYLEVGKRNRQPCWTARIGFKGKSIYLGYFTSIKAAQKARQDKAKELFGKFYSG